MEEEMMIENCRSVIELDEDHEPFVRLTDELGDYTVPVRLRGEDENLTPAWRGHEVNHLSWFKIERYDRGAAGWALLADHDEKNCPRCALWAEADYRRTVPIKMLDHENWEATADFIQAFHRDFLQRWTNTPGPLDPMLNHPLRRERARLRVDVEKLRNWLNVAISYVHARMEALRKEEYHLSLTRSSLQFLTFFGVYQVKEVDADPIFTHNGMTWRVFPDGKTQRLTETKDPSGLAIKSWVTDDTGCELPGWFEARDRARIRNAERSQTPGHRRARPYEFNMAARDRILREKTRDVHECASKLRGQLESLTREIVSD